MKEEEGLWLKKLEDLCKKMMVMSLENLIILGLKSK
jgi:hypothetical protein